MIENHIFQILLIHFISDNAIKSRGLIVSFIHFFNQFSCVLLPIFENISLTLFDHRIFPTFYCCGNWVSTKAHCRLMKVSPTVIRNDVVVFAHIQEG